MEWLARLRTILWMPFFYLGTVVLVIGVGLAALISMPAMVFAVRLWPRWQRLCARMFLGQKIVVDGEIPHGAAFVLIKHEDMFETIDMPLMFDRPAVFAKRELFDMPLWGMLAHRYGLIAIERQAGASALRAMRKAALAAHAAGRPLVLFPEGTRVPHGEAPPLRAGFAGLYGLLRMPVVPIAVDSGRLKRGWVRYPGIITYRVGTTIPAGLDRAEAERRAHAAINALNPAGGKDGPV